MKYEVTPCCTSEKSHWGLDLHDPHLSRCGQMWIMPSEPCYSSHRRFPDKGIIDGRPIASQRVPPLPLHHPVSLSIFLPLTLSVFQWFDGSSWQMTISFPFRRGPPLSGGLSHAIAISVTLNPSTGRWERQCDREAIHSRHYLRLCGWHP